MTPDEAADFYEDDEDPAEILRRFDAGKRRGVTASPASENVRLLRCAIYVGGFATSLGLLAAAFARIPGLSTSEEWLITTGALAVIGVPLAAPILRVLDRKGSR